MSDRWTPERIAEMRRRYAAEGPMTLAAEWGIGATAIKNKAYRMGLHVSRYKLREINQANKLARRIERPREDVPDFNAWMRTGPIGQTWRIAA